MISAQCWRSWHATLQSPERRSEKPRTRSIKQPSATFAPSRSKSARRKVDTSAEFYPRPGVLPLNMCYRSVLPYILQAPTKNQQGKPYRATRQVRKEAIRAAIALVGKRIEGVTITDEDGQIYQPANLHIFFQ